MLCKAKILISSSHTSRPTYFSSMLISSRLNLYPDAQAQAPCISYSFCRRLIHSIIYIHNIVNSSRCFRIHLSHPRFPNSRFRRSNPAQDQNPQPLLIIRRHITITHPTPKTPTPPRMSPSRLRRMARRRRPLPLPPPNTPPPLPPSPLPLPLHHRFSHPNLPRTRASP